MKVKDSYLTVDESRAKKYVVRCGFFTPRLRVAFTNKFKAETYDHEIVEQLKFMQQALDELSVSDYRERLQYADWNILRKLIGGQFSLKAEIVTRIAFQQTVKSANAIPQIDLVNPTVTDMINLYIKTRIENNDPLDKGSAHIYYWWTDLSPIKDLLLVDVADYDMADIRIQLLNSGRKGTRGESTVDKFMSSFKVPWEQFRPKVKHLKLPVVPWEFKAFLPEVIPSTGYTREVCEQIIDVMGLEDYQACTDPTKLRMRTFQHMQALVMVGLMCGIRLQNLLSLHVDELNLDGEIITTTKKMKGKKGQKLRTVAFSPELSALIRERIALGENLMTPARDNEGFIFPFIQEDGKIGSFEWSKRFKILLVKHNIPIYGKMPFHALRKSCGTLMAEDGADDATIAKQLAHKDIKSVKHYTENTQKVLAAQTKFSPSFKKPRKQAPRNYSKVVPIRP